MAIACCVCVCVAIACCELGQMYLSGCPVVGNICSPPGFLNCLHFSVSSDGITQKQVGNLWYVHIFLLYQLSWNKFTFPK